MSIDFLSLAGFTGAFANTLLIQERPGVLPLVAVVQVTVHIDSVTWPVRLLRGNAWSLVIRIGRDCILIGDLRGLRSVIAL